jgi:hypothetical protein
MVSGVYIDAFEWVELPNTVGMSQFADGGLLASKPYVSGNAYLHRMGNYCGDCHYRRDARHGTMPAPSMRCTGTSSSASAPGWATTRGWRWCTASWTRCQPLNKRPSATVRRPSCKAWTSYEPTQGVHHATHLSNLRTLLLLAGSLLLAACSTLPPPGISRSAVSTCNATAANGMKLPGSTTASSAA